MTSNNDDDSLYQLIRHVRWEFMRNRPIFKVMSRRAPSGKRYVLLDDIYAAMNNRGEAALFLDELCRVPVRIFKDATGRLSHITFFPGQMLFYRKGHEDPYSILAGQGLDEPELQQIQYAPYPPMQIYRPQVDPLQDLHLTQQQPQSPPRAPVRNPSKYRVPPPSKYPSYQEPLGPPEFPSQYALAQTPDPERAGFTQGQGTYTDIGLRIFVHDQELLNPLQRAAMGDPTNPLDPSFGPTTIDWASLSLDELKYFVTTRTDQLTEDILAVMNGQLPPGFVPSGPVSPGGPSGVDGTTSPGPKYDPGSPSDYLQQHHISPSPTNATSNPPSPPPQQHPPPNSPATSAQDFHYSRRMNSYPELQPDDSGSVQMWNRYRQAQHRAAIARFNLNEGVVGFTNIANKSIPNARPALQPPQDVFPTGVVPEPEESLVKKAERAKSLLGPYGRQNPYTRRLRRRAHPSVLQRANSLPEAKELERRLPFSAPWMPQPQPSKPAPAPTAIAPAPGAGVLTAAPTQGAPATGPTHAANVAIGEPSTSSSSSRPPPAPPSFGITLRRLAEWNATAGHEKKTRESQHLEYGVYQWSKSLHHYEFPNHSNISAEDPVADPATTTASPTGPAEPVHEENANLECVDGQATKEAVVVECDIVEQADQVDMTPGQDHAGVDDDGFGSGQVFDNNVSEESQASHPSLVFVRHDDFLELNVEEKLLEEEKGPSGRVGIEMSGSPQPSSPKRKRSSEDEGEEEREAGASKGLRPSSSESSASQGTAETLTGPGYISKGKGRAL
ncbi:hypothetical protein BGX29_008125 [Mortierella sp. GBA35]|nr:hypothetical protein BGX29_008125 [Mortierella sp. GBA35]